MKMRLHTGPRAYDRLAVGLCPAFAALVLAAHPAAAQVVGEVGPLSSQSLFFDQASNLHGQNYLEAEAGVVGTDNATLVERGPSDILGIVGLAADASRQGPGLDYHLDSDLALVKYVREDLPTKPTGYLDGGAELKIVPGMLSWTARETYSDVVVDAFAPVTPENLESLNYLTTGPRLTLRPTLRTTVTVEGTYSLVNSGSEAPDYLDLDNHRYAGDLRIDRALSSTSSVYLSGSSVQVDFRDQVLNTNFTQDEAFLGFRFVDGRTIVDISGGYERVHEGTVTPSGGTYRVQLSRLITPRQRVSLHALQLLTDAANLLRLFLDQPVATSAPTEYARDEPMTFRSYGADWRLEAERTSLEVALSYNSQRYRLGPTLNNDTKVADIVLTRQLRPALDLFVGADLQHQDYALVRPVWVANSLAGLRWQAGERLGVRLVYAHNTLTPHGAANQVGLSVYYGLIQPKPVVSETAAAAGASPVMLPTSPMSTQTPPH
ncbi:MAG TPA: hypothetical protein VLV25_12045 [Steroidobacteraceae bacterium]|nr:hypothetical protein [Steroidobacteraceae bacterium]